MAALERLAAEPFGLAVLDLDEGRSWSALSAGKELRPFTDLVFLMAGWIPSLRRGLRRARPPPCCRGRCPDNDALLRAHLRWLASCRRSRTRGLLLRNALHRHGEELAEIEPALAKALARDRRRRRPRADGAW